MPNYASERWKTIAVSGDAPIVDVQSTTRQRVMDEEVISTLPAARNMFELGVDANNNFTPDCDLLDLNAQDLRSSGGDFCDVGSNRNTFGLATPNRV